MSDVTEEKKGTLNDIREGIITELGTPEITEHVFINVMLPLFFKKDPKLFNNAWLHVAKTPFTRANVVSREGAVLFSVPPLRANPITPKTNAFSRLAIEVSNARRIGGEHAARVINVNIPQLINFDEKEENTYRDEWIAILSRYGLDGRVKQDETPSAIESNDTMEDW